MKPSKFVGRARKPRRRVRVALGLLVTGASLHSTAGFGQSDHAAQRRLAQAYIAAIRSQDAPAVKALWHPASRACETGDTRVFFEQILAHQLRDGVDVGFRYEVKSIEPVLARNYQNLLPSRYYKFPVPPAYTMEVDAHSSTRQSVKLAIIVMYLAPANGNWFIDTPCPTAEGLAVLGQKRLR